MRVDAYALPYTRAMIFHGERTPSVVFDLKEKKVELHINGARSFVKFSNNAVAFPRRTLGRLEKKYDR